MSIYLIILLLSYAFNYFAIRIVLQNEHEGIWVETISNNLFLAFVVFITPILGLAMSIADLYSLFADRWMKHNKTKILNKIFFLKEDKEL